MARSAARERDLPTLAFPAGFPRRGGAFVDSESPPTYPLTTAIPGFGMAFLERGDPSVLRRIRAGAGKLKRKAREWYARRKRWRHTRHLHGPDHVVLSDTEVMVVLLARDAEWFIRHFLDHHLALGARHILVIDNGSTDATINICRGYDRVSVLQNRLPAKLHESAFRSEFSQRVARGGWILFADADELVELPLEGADALERLIGYCNRHGHTAVLGQMLDRFSTLPYGETRDLDYAESIRSMKWYSLKGLETLGYHDREEIGFSWFLRDNRCDDPQVRFHRGGVRAELFGERPFLSKHSLVRNRPGIIPMSHPHCASNVVVADMALVLHHYKLAGDWIARDRASAQEAWWQHDEDAQRLATTGDATDAYRLSPAEPRLWRGIEALYDEGFLYASPAFRQFARENPRAGPGGDLPAQ